MDTGSIHHMVKQHFQCWAGNGKLLAFRFRIPNKNTNSSKGIGGYDYVGQSTRQALSFPRFTLKFHAQSLDCEA